MGPDKKRSKTRMFAAENVPTFFVVFILSCGLLLFGADAPPSSLFISLFCFAAILVSLLFFHDVKFSALIQFMLVLWVIFAVLSYVTGRTMGGEDEYLMLLSAIGIFGLGQYAGQNSNRIKTALKLFLILGGIFSALAFLQHTVAPGMILGRPRPYSNGRLFGSFLSSNTTATFLGVVFLIALSFFRRSWLMQVSVSNSTGVVLFFEVFQKTYSVIVTGLFSVVCLLLTASRAGVASAFLATIVFGIWVTLQHLLGGNARGQGRAAMRLFVLMVIAILTIYLWNLSGGMVSTRYERSFDDIAPRAGILEASWQAFLREPWFGHGLGRFDVARLLGTTPENNADVVKVHAAHNVFAQWLVQVGAVGVAVFGCIYAFVLARIFNGARRARRYKTYCVALLCISLFVGLHGLVDYAMEIPVVMLSYAWLMGIGYGISMRYVRSE